MKVDKMSVSFDADLGDAIRAGAARRGTPLSTWLAEAAAAKLRSEALASYLEAWEAQHGRLTPQEVSKAEAELGLICAVEAS